MKTEQELRKKIMRRVYGVYVLRQVTSPFLRAAVFGIALIALFQFVSVKNVLANALQTSGFSGLTNFLYSAVISTEPSVLVLVSLAVALALWFAVDQVRPNSQFA